MPLSTNLTTGQTGHVARHNEERTAINTVEADLNTLETRVNGLSSSSGTVLGWQNVQVHGAIGDGVADDTAAIESAIIAAGPCGTVFFPKTTRTYRITRSLKPYERQLWLGEQYPRYAWDSDQATAGGSIIRASSTFTGPAVIYNDPSKTNGLLSNGNPVIAASRGVIFRSLGVFGNGEGGAVDGVDFGPASGSERAWMLDRCQIMYCGTAICGYMWVSTVKDCHISRNGYGIAPHRGVDSTSRLNDSLIGDNYFYFNLHHAVELGGSVESGLVILRNNRFERSGVSMDPMNPNINRDENACGVLITRATGVVIQGNTTDANARQGLRIAAVAHGLVNNVTMTGNVWKRDGTGNNTTSNLSGVVIRDAMYVRIMGDIITYGDPDDTGDGRSAPQYGWEFEANEWLRGEVSTQLPTNALTRSNGFRWMNPRTVTDGVLNGTTTVTSASADFTSEDVYRTISGTGIPTGARIVTVVSATQVTISAAATASSTGTNLTFGTSNYMSGVSDTRQPMMMVPYDITANAPLNPQKGYMYFDDTLDVLRVYTGSVWKSATMT